MRIWSRKIARGHVMLDMSDWLLVGACVFYLGFVSTFAATTAYGEGRHIVFATNPRMLIITTMLAEIFSNLSMGFIKFSILRFYGSIFTSRAFHYSLWGVAILVGGLTVATPIVTVIQCVPIEFGWDKTVTGGYCIDYGLMVLVVCIINIVTDFVILVMPIPLVRQLHVSRRRKDMLTITFAMGSSACIVGVIRIVFTLGVGTGAGSADSPWDNVMSGALSVVELMTGLLAVSIPTYRPLFKHVFYSSEVSSNYQNHRMTESYRNIPSHTAQVSVGTFRRETRPGIRVTDQIELIKHAAQDRSWVMVIDKDGVELIGTRDLERCNPVKFEN
ncbi:hypothetical protein GGR53DRAFT_467259 [Hypoxylon sp. FL1150]|nr:hypothetical protein GGR53DRAFT_467259 [Hypoxylon sp. FL1150]